MAKFRHLVSLFFQISLVFPLLLDGSGLVSLANCETNWMEKKNDDVTDQWTDSRWWWW
jgi:hypothetical protein